MKFRFRVVPFLLALTLIFLPLKAYALEDNLVRNTGMWREIDTVIQYGSDDFSGYTKYICDEENGCFYVYLNFTDYRLNSSINDEIKLNFILRNSDGEYSFSVDKNGLTEEWAHDKVSASVNFDVSYKNQGGKVIAGIELKDKRAEKLTNYIGCYYSCGSEISTELFEDILLDMYVPPAAKTTTEKTTADKSATRKRDAQNENSTTDKISKFNPSGVKTTSKGTTKFDSRAGTGVDDAVTASQDDEEFWENELNSAGARSSETGSKDSIKPVLSVQAKILLSVAVVLFVCGMVFVVTGAVKKENKKENTEEHDE